MQEMIAIYIVCLVVGIAAFFLLAKLQMPLRILIALALAVVPSVAVTLWVARVGDKPPPDARTVVPTSGNEADPP